VFQQLVTVYTNGTAVVCDMKTEQPIIRFNTAHPSLVTAACLDARERRLITASHSGSVHVHNFNNAALLHTYSPRSAEISELIPLPQLSSSSSYSIVASCWDKRVCLWPDKEQTQAGMDVMELSAHKTDVTCVVQYGQYLASGSADGMLMIWYSRSVDFNFARLPKFKYRVPGTHGSRGQPSVTRLLYLPQQHLLLVCIQDGSMHLYSAHGHGLVKAGVAYAGDGVAAIALAPSETMVVTGDYLGRLILWDVRGVGDGTFLEQRSSSCEDDVEPLAPNADGGAEIFPAENLGESAANAALSPPTWQHQTKAAVSSIAFCYSPEQPWQVLCR
jgi:WD40 repeat protein